MATFGFIGVGNMGGALARAAARSEGGEKLMVSSRTRSRAEALAQELRCRAVSNEEIASQADFIFLGVKPQMLGSLLAGLAPILRARIDRFVLVSMAAGTPIAKIQALLGMECPVIRIMPNTPVSVGEGIILHACSGEVTENERNMLIGSLREAGMLIALPENQIDAGSTVSACAPAFADLFMEALADGGVACGLPRAAAMEMAAQMLVGSGKLLLASGRHPGELKDAVCSPGGTTIQGVRKLEQSGFRGAVLEAVIAAFEKNREFAK
ncbi:MAG: pyrroline-5-carboxylate reductase [Desulfovibrionaceae bacterium]|nr:pyrroline-5-carboxylate reductase [Desulfovibrionaceae bacterium]